MGFFNYVSDNLDEIIKSLVQHIQITLVAVLLSIIVGVPLGIIINRYKKVDKYVIGVMNVIQAIPSLALLGFFIPVLGIGALPAVVMVILYSLLPIVKNTYTGLQSINPRMLEAAKGIGLTRSQILTKVEIPLALPVIMSGIRISAVTAVGLVTIAAFVGAGGLGYLVYSGIQTVNSYQILAGAIPACILALFMDFIFSIIESIVTPIPLRKNGIADSKKVDKKNKIIISTVSVIVALMIIITLISNNSSNNKTITIGSKNFTEQIILSNMFALLVENKTDIDVNEKFNLGGTQVVFSGMKKGDIDMYVEYTGTGLVDVLKKSPTTDSDAAYNTVKDEYYKRYNIKWLNPIGFNNTFALAVEKKISDEKNIKSISDLYKYNKQLNIAPTMEFANREDGLIGLKSYYGLDFKNTSSMDAGLRYKAIEKGNADVIDAFSTDGLLKKYDLEVLEDDKSFFPPYYAVPIVNESTLKKYPELEEVLNLLSEKINDEKMIDLNYKVDVEGKEYKSVAKQFLIEEGIYN